ncbi:MAG: SDR family NAD(P)-dependent oxidoreductase, partial [Bacilli bacterium]|nr:SDR family NAD(P)-dependent oxidoreductase [Bacilli bacterium]
TQVNIEKTFYEVIKKHNYIDAFISAIGYYGVKKIEEFSTEEYYKTLNINLNIPTFFTIKAIREMQQLGRGKIILLSSAAAYVGSRDIPYSISKSALSGLIRGVCNNLKNANIYVYGIAPGIVETNMSDNMDFSRQKDTIDRTINKRKCQPTEIANLVKFLLEEEKGYMNGSIIHINNGLYFN